MDLETVLPPLTVTRVLAAEPILRETWYPVAPLTYFHFTVNFREPVFFR